MRQLLVLAQLPIAARTLGTPSIATDPLLGNKVFLHRFEMTPLFACTVMSDKPELFDASFRVASVIFLRVFQTVPFSQRWAGFSEGVQGAGPKRWACQTRLL